MSANDLEVAPQQSNSVRLQRKVEILIDKIIGVHQGNVLYNTMNTFEYSANIIDAVRSLIFKKRRYIFKPRQKRK